MEAGWLLEGVICDRLEGCCVRVGEREMLWWVSRRESKENGGHWVCGEESDEHGWRDGMEWRRGWRGDGCKKEKTG